METQREKNQAAIDLLESWLNETPTPEEIEAERKSLAELMVYLMRPTTNRESIIEACAQIAERTYPRGEAHTYASENADRYIALEDACVEVAKRIRALK